ncbi:hypothetical protein HPDP_00852 [Candidatus Hepatincola sp. Pdp]
MKSSNTNNISTILFLKLFKIYILETQNSNVSRETLVKKLVNSWCSG